MVRKLYSVFLALSTLTAVTLYSPSAQAVDITGTVPSAVSSSKSTVVADLSSIPADNSTTVTITISLVDDSNNPLPNKTIVLTSSRNGLDNIRCYVGTQLQNTNQTQSDSNGTAKCLVSSSTAGKSVMTAVAEGVTLSDQPSITFTPLPTVSKVIITIPTPLGPVNLLPPFGKPDLNHTSGSANLPAGTVALEVPYSLVVSVSIFFLILLLIMVILLFYLHKIRSLVKAEQQHLQTTETPNE